MSELPERIWALWDDAYGDGVDKVEEYVRADRIEELEAKLSKSKALLAKAVEALGRIGSGEFSGQMLTSMPPQDAAAYFARITIAGLKGTKQ